MSRYNEILVGRFAQGVQKLFGIKGEVPVASLAGELVVAHSLMSGRENRFLEGWRLFGGRAATNAVAAQDSVIRLNNPLSSNTVIVVESIKLAAGGTAFEAFMDYGTPAAGNLTNVITPVNFDLRTTPTQSGNNGAQATLSWANNIGAPGAFTFDDIQTAINSNSLEMINYESQEIPVLPNTYMQARSVQLNVSITMTIRWRERFLEEQERA